MGNHEARKKQSGSQFSKFSYSVSVWLAFCRVALVLSCICEPREPTTTTSHVWRPEGPRRRNHQSSGLVNEERVERAKPKHNKPPDRTVWKRILVTRECYFSMPKRVGENFVNRETLDVGCCCRMEREILRMGANWCLRFETDSEWGAHSFEPTSSRREPLSTYQKVEIANLFWSYIHGASKAITAREPWVKPSSGFCNPMQRYLNVTQLLADNLISIDKWYTAKQEPLNIHKMQMAKENNGFTGTDVCVRGIHTMERHWHRHRASWKNAFFSS